MEKYYKAGIFDLDGVITQTASLHAKAWKKMFDAYNGKLKENGEKGFRAFSIEGDYPKYLDGVPRYQGVEAFLKSRGIELVYGDPNDGPEKETICGLGNLKNELFLETIEKEGVKTFDKNIMAIKKWKNNGLKTAIISSSKNCKQILETVGLTKLFDVRVDGMVSKERGLKGKPLPDIFLEAAKDLEVNTNEAFIVEDAISGIQAGKAGKFKYVVGMATMNSKQKLMDAGADIAVDDLTELEHGPHERHVQDLPHALHHLDKIKQFLKNKKFNLYLDYDGTLTPIVEDHTQAHLSEQMKETLLAISRKMPIAIVSGRDTAFIQHQVGLDRLYYAGSHGFEIKGPNNYYFVTEKGQQLLPQLDQAEKDFHEMLQPIEGVKIERKKYAIAIHFRQVAENDLAKLQHLVDNALKTLTKLKLSGGKKIMEISPDIDWHKGKAVEVLSRHIGNNGMADSALYIGDDVTDENAFKSLTDGIGIVVGNRADCTFADYRLNDVDEVRAFLGSLLEIVN
jgi:trehalose 6-phosphate phosphatase